MDTRASESSTAESRSKKMKMAATAESYESFSRSEMAAAEQLVQLSDHSDASSCDRRSGVDDDDDVEEKRGEICSTSPAAAKIKIEEIFGRFDDDDKEEELSRRRKKYGSLAQIYKATKPLIRNRS